MDYYKKEINRVGFNHVSVKFYGENDDSRTLDLNKESIRAIMDYLTELEQKLSN